MTSAAGTVPVSPPGARTRRSLGARLREWAPPIVLFVGFLVVWEVLVRGLGISQFVLPAPTAIAEAWVTYLPEISAAAREAIMAAPPGRRRPAGGGRGTPPRRRAGR